MSVRVQRLRSGDKQAFKELFDEFYQTLCLFAARFLKDDALAADVVQEVFVKFWERHTDFDNDLKVKSYLYTSVRNACLEYNRDKKEFIPEGESLAQLKRRLFSRIRFWNVKVCVYFMPPSILYLPRDVKLFIWP